MLLNNRHGSVDADSYRYGFMGEERDDEIKGEGNHISYAERGYDPRVGRWISVDAYAPLFAGHSPYNYALNNPIFFMDQEGNWPKPSDYFKVKDPLLRGVMDGIWEGLTGTAGFLWDYATDSEFRQQTNAAFMQMVNDPMGTLQTLMNEYGGMIERIMTGNATDDDIYQVGMQLGESGVGLLLGGSTLAVGLGKKFLKKTLKKGTKVDVGKAGKKIDADGNISGTGLDKLKNDINPSGGLKNCVLCSIAFENKVTKGIYEAAKKTGADSDYINTIKKAFPNVKRKTGYGGMKGLNNILENVKSKSVIIVGHYRKTVGADVDAHAFNAINDKGVWKFIDTQSGEVLSSEYIQKSFGKVEVFESNVKN